MRIIYDTSSRMLCADGGHGTTVSISLDGAMRAMRSLARRGGISGYDGGEDISGIFDFAKKALHALGRIAKNPLFRAVAGIIPYGGTALTVVEMGDSAFSAGVGAIAKNKAVHRHIAKAIATNNPAAIAAARKAAGGAKALKSHLALHASAHLLAQDLAEAKQALHAAGYTPALVSALRFAQEPIWRHVTRR